MFKLLLEKVKLLKQRATNNKCKAYVRGQRTGDTVFDNIIEECDRACKRTDATIIYFNNEVKEK